MGFTIACTNQQVQIDLADLGTFQVSRPKISCNLGTRLQSGKCICRVLDVYLVLLIIGFQTL